MDSEAPTPASSEPLIPDLNVEAVIEALQATRGNISKTSLVLDKPYNQVRKFCQAKPELVILINDLRDSIIDKAEDNIFNAVEAGDIGQSNFVVSTLGKNRGWTSRQEMTGKDDAPLVPPSIIVRRYGPEDDAPAAPDVTET